MIHVATSKFSVHHGKSTSRFHIRIPDLTSSDFYLFGPLRDALQAKRFVNNEEVKKAKQNWLGD